MIILFAIIYATIGIATYKLSQVCLAAVLGPHGPKAMPVVSALIWPVALTYMITICAAEIIYSRICLYLEQRNWEAGTEVLQRKYHCQLIQNGISKEEADALFAKMQSDDEKIDVRCCLECGEELLRTRDERTAGAPQAALRAGYVWFKYRCSACSFCIDRLERPPSR